MLRGLSWAVGLIFLTLAPALAGPPSRTLLQGEIRGQRVEGLPLIWSAERHCLLGRDGRLWDLGAADAERFQKFTGDFHGDSQSQVRAELQREFGSRLEVTGTGHYLVAHPPNQGAQWAQRFEDLYRSFVHNFAVRGFTVKEPRFPLVAVVWTRHDDFLRYAMSQGDRVNPSVLGYYSPLSNRIMLFDITAGRDRSIDWHQNAETIIHEATHQTAFNTGVHSRLTLPPRWLAEGLGTLYEAPGVWDPYHYAGAGDRVNRGRLRQFKQYLAAGRPPGAFLEVIVSDRLFQNNPGAAYAEAWALTYFLTETQPRQYSEYLRRTTAHGKSAAVSSARRLADFTAIFGEDWRLFDANYLRFIDAVKR